MTKALGPLARPWLSATRGRLRVLGYHGVSDAGRFRRQMGYLKERFRVMSPPIAGQASDDKPMVWITFDDGDPSVVNVALPVLNEFQVRATLFVCPGVVDTEEPYWWQMVGAAAERRLVVDGSPVTTQLVTLLKRVPDHRRLEKVARIKAGLEKVTGKPLRVPQLTTKQLSAWVDAGHTVGNHTWDHPILDQCDHDTQREQIERAHKWLAKNVSPEHRLFAYPNGNWTAYAEDQLALHSYQTAVLFDHRLARLDNPLQLSRVRVNADDDLDTFILRVSGIHPTLHHTLGREKRIVTGG